MLVGSGKNLRKVGNVTEEESRGKRGIGVSSREKPEKKDKDSKVGT